MLHEVLIAYLDRVERAVLQCRNAYVERYSEEILTSERTSLRIRLRFEQGHLLEINEAVMIADDKLVSLDYRYHCQNEQNQMIFRYGRYSRTLQVPAHQLPDFSSDQNEGR